MCHRGVGRDTTSPTSRPRSSGRGGPPSSTASATSAVAVAQGAPLTNGFQLPRQSQHVLLPLRDRDARRVPAPRRAHPARHALPPAAQRAARAVGGQGALRRGRRSRAPPRPGSTTCARPTDMGTAWPVGDAKVEIYAETAPAEGYAQSRHELAGRRRRDRHRPLGRPPAPRDAASVELLRLRNPRASIRDLTPDPRRAAQRQEPARDRARAAGVADRGARGDRGDAQHASRGRGSTSSTRRPATSSSQNGARLDGYRSITASGTANIWNGHYYRNDTQLARRRPRADGLRARLPLLRERHRAHVAGRRDLRAVAAGAAAVRPRVPERRARPHPARGDDGRDPGRGAGGDGAGGGPDPVLEARVREGGAQDAGDGRRASSRTRSGMAVHDVGSYRQAPLRPGPGVRGRPAAVGAGGERSTSATRTRWWSPRRGSRTSPRFLPAELDAIEAVVRGKGVLQSLPALTEAGFEALREREAVMRRVAAAVLAMAARPAWRGRTPTRASPGSTSCTTPSA